MAPKRWKNLAHTLITLALAVALLLNLGTLFWRSLQAPLSIDEGYNLEVVDNLAKGGGFASYGSRRLDSFWSARNLFQAETFSFAPYENWPFDPRVTTGPAVLVPLAAFWALTPGQIAPLRLVLWVLALLLLWSLWCLSPAGEALAFLSAAAVLGSLWFGFHPGAVLGEVPGATYFLLGLWAHSRGLWLVSGLLFGLAIQSKLLYALPVLAALAFVVITEKTNLKAKVGRLLLWGLGLLLPTLAFELFRAASLGFHGWLASWREFSAFSREQTAAGVARRAISTKLTSIGEIGPGWFLVLAALFASLTSALLGRTLRDSDENSSRKGALALGSAGLVTFLFWFFFSVQTSYRQAVPGILLGFPGLFLASRWWQGLQAAASPKPKGRAIAAWVSAWATALCLLAALASWTVRAVRFRGWEEGGFRAQLQVAEALRHAGVSAISPVVAWVEPFPLLTGLRVAPCPGPGQVLVVTSWARAVVGQRAAELRSLCATMLADTREALACLPVPSLQNSGTGMLPISRWGPRDTPVGQLPNPQRNGMGALWFQLAEPVPSRPRVLLVLEGQPVGMASWSADARWFSAPVPPAFVSRPGELLVDLYQPCLSRRQSVGRLRVAPASGGN